MKEIKNVVILGGGTAGWLAAYILSDFFYSNKLNTNVKIIESSKIPTIGVGAVSYTHLTLPTKRIV